MSKKRFLLGTFVLTCTGFLSRILGFFYRIFLSHSIGAEGLGIVQLTMPVQTLALAVSASGVQTAISRLTASRIALKKEKGARQCFFLGTGTALALSFLCAALLYLNADFFALEILKEERTLPLLKILSFTFPLSTLHTCANSYYFARKQTILPSVIQLLEQTVRIGSTYILYLILTAERKDVTPAIAASGALASEIAASLALLLALSFHFQQCTKPLFSVKNIRPIFRELTETSLPLTINRILLTILGGIETILIPQMLLSCGFPKENALELYGIFTGMALPLILFPSAVTNSASVLLMPSVAELQALGHSSRIREVVKKAFLYCLVLGSFFSLLFLIFGKQAGILLFKNSSAGIYIQSMSFMCPFLYLNTALSSILNGIGKSGLCLFYSITGILIRLLFVIFFIPVLGMRGYIYGILISELTRTFLYFFTFRKIL